MTEEIKPCPFCGSEIEEKDFVEEWIGWWVTCPVCDSLPVPTTKEEAMQQWNQRPYDYDMPAIVKKVQRMEAALKIFANPESWNDEGYSSYTEFPFAKGDPITIAKQALGESCKQPE